jgi:hypothetical protein
MLVILHVFLDSFRLIENMELQTYMQINNLLNNKKNFFFLSLTMFCFLILFMKKSNNESEYELKANPETNPKIHVSYVHYLDTTDGVTSQNFQFFLHFAYEPCHVDVDYTIILNVNEIGNQSIFERALFRNAFGVNNTNLINKFKSCQESNNPNRNTFLIVRKNIYGGDLCAHAELVKSDFWQTKRNNYLYYFFINSSARGPFVPNYWTSKW